MIKLSNIDYYNYDIIEDNQKLIYSVFYFIKKITSFRLIKIIFLNVVFV